MLKLQLDPDEATMLREVLESYLSDLRYEIVATETPSFRDALKQREVFLKRLIAELEVAAQSS